MSNYDIFYLGKKAIELDFNRDTLEKVVRLADILEYLNTDIILRYRLALKGGTAINLVLFNLPRLSVDIDLDYLITNNKEEMLKDRELINQIIERYMVSLGYGVNLKSKNHHSLDSWVYSYIGVSGNRDNIKIEINYSLRAHILNVVESVITSQINHEVKVTILDPIEIYACKINALLNRAASRDLYDTKNMIVYKLFNESEKQLLKKCIIFYAAISARDKSNINKSFNTDAINRITSQSIKRELKPVIKKEDYFDLDKSKEIVIDFISKFMVLTEEENRFLDLFENGEYKPELLFKDKDILMRIERHPMVMWRIQ